MSILSNHNMLFVVLAVIELHVSPANIHTIRLITIIEYSVRMNKDEGANELLVQ